jgi:hypothetical protein
LIRKDGTLVSQTENSKDYGIQVNTADKIINGKVMSFYGNQTKDPLKHGNPVEWVLYYNNNSRQGEAIKYWPSGKVSQKLTYKDDKVEGKAITYYESGNLKSELNYVNNQWDGIQNVYYETGEIRGQLYFNKGNEDYELEFFKNGFVKAVRMPIPNGETFSLEYQSSHQIKSMTKDQVVAEYEKYLKSKAEKEMTKQLRQEQEAKIARRNAQKSKSRLVAKYTKDAKWVLVDSLAPKTVVKGTSTLDLNGRYNRQIIKTTVFKNISKGELAIIIELRPESEIQGRFEVTLRDRHKSYLKHFYTDDFVESRKYRTYRTFGTGTIRPGEEVKEFVYQVNVRDLRDADIVEISFDLEDRSF